MSTEESYDDVNLPHLKEMENKDIRTVFINKNPFGK